MSAPEKRGPPSRAPYLMLAALCLGLGVVALLLGNRAEQAAERLAGGKVELAGMIKTLNDAGAAPQARHPEPRILDAPWTNHIAYLDKVRDDSGIDRRHMTAFNLSGPTPWREQWDEHVLTVNVQVKQGDLLPAERLIRFLDRVEKEQGFLKTTKLNLTLEEGNARNPVLQMKYWIPRNPPPGTSKNP